MGQSYYDFMMKQPGIASSLVAGVAADRESQNKERLRQASADLKRRLLEEARRSAELDRVQRLSNDLSLAPEQMAAAGAKAQESAASENARYTPAPPVFKEAASASDLEDSINQAVAEVPSLTNLRTSVAPGAKRRELTKDKFDDKLNRTYHRTEDVDIVTQNRGAFVDPGTGEAFASHAAYKADKLEKASAEARRRSEIAKADDAKNLRDAYTVKVADLKALKGDAYNQLKALGLEDKDITPDMVSKAQEKFDTLIRQENAAYVAKLNKATANGTKKTISKKAAAELTPMKEKLDSLLGMRNRISGAGTTYKQAHGEFQKSIDDDARKILQDIMVTNPIIDAPDPRVDEERSFATALKDRLPEIMQLQSVDPEGSKVLLNILGKESKQGDAGLEAERKAAIEERRSNTRLLASFSQGQNDFEYKAAQVAQGWAKLEELRKKREDAKTKSDKEAAQKDLEIADKEQNTRLRLLEESGRNVRNLRDVNSRDYGNSSLAAWTPEVRQMFALKQQATIDPSVPANYDRALANVTEGLGGFKTSAPPKMVGNRPSEGMFDKGGQVLQDVPTPPPLPPIEGSQGGQVPPPAPPAKGGPAKRHDLKTRTATLTSKEKAFLKGRGKDPSKYTVTVGSDGNRSIREIGK